MAEEEEFVILYTAQKTKKAKTWHDGMLKVFSAASKAVLYDDKKTRLDTLFVKAADVLQGEQIESDRYLILIEEKRSRTSSSHVPSATSSCGGRPLSGNRVQTAPRGGLRRGNRKGFVPPRICKQIEDDSSSADLSCLSAKQGSTTRLCPLQGMTSYRASITNLYSRNTPGQDQAPAGVPQAGSLDRTAAFPKERAHQTGMDRLGSFRNRGRTDQSGPGLPTATATAAESQGTGCEDSDISPQLSNFMSMLHGRGGSRERSPSQQDRKRLKCNPWRTFGSRSNSDSQGSQTSEENSQEQYKPRTITTDYSAFKAENNKCKGTEMVQTDGGPNYLGLETSSYTDDSVNKSHSKFTASTKRSTSQIMALLKHKPVSSIYQNVKSDNMSSNQSLPKNNLIVEVAQDYKNSDLRIEESVVGAGFSDVPGNDGLFDKQMTSNKNMVPASEINECSDENDDHDNEEDCAVNPFELSDATFDINFSPLSHVSSSDEDEDEQTDLEKRDCVAGSPHEAPAVRQVESPGIEPDARQKMTDDNLHCIAGCVTAVNPQEAPSAKQVQNPSGIERDARQALADDNLHCMARCAVSEYSQEAVDLSGKGENALQEMAEKNNQCCVAATGTASNPLLAAPVKQVESLSGIGQDAKQAMSEDNTQCIAEGATGGIPRESPLVVQTERCSGIAEEAGQALVESDVARDEKEDVMFNLSSWGDIEPGSVDRDLFQLSEAEFSADRIQGKRSMEMLSDTRVSRTTKLVDDKGESTDSSDGPKSKVMLRTIEDCPDGSPETGRSIPDSEGHGDTDTPTDKMGNTNPYTETEKQICSQISEHVSPEIHKSINPLNNLLFSPDSFDLNSSLSQFSQSGFLGRLNAASTVSDRNENLSSVSLKSPSFSAFDDKLPRQFGFHKESLPLQINKQSVLSHRQFRESDDALTDNFSGPQNKSCLSVEAGRHISREWEDPHNILKSSDVQQGQGISCVDDATNITDNHTEPRPNSMPSYEAEQCSETPEQDHRQHLQELRPDCSVDTSLHPEKQTSCNISKPEYDNIANSNHCISNQDTHTQQDSVSDMFSSVSSKDDIEYKFPSSGESVMSTVFADDVDQLRHATESLMVQPGDLDMSFPMPDTPDIPMAGSQTSLDTKLEYPEKVSNQSDESPLSHTQIFPRTLTGTVTSTQRKYLTSDSIISMRGRPQNESSRRVSSRDQEPYVLQADRNTLKHIPASSDGHLRLRHDRVIPDGHLTLRQLEAVDDSYVQRQEDFVRAEKAPPLPPPSRLYRRQGDMCDPHQNQDLHCQASRKLGGYLVKGMVASGVVRRDGLPRTHTQDMPEDPLGPPSSTGVRCTRQYERPSIVTQIQLKAALEKVSSGCTQIGGQTSPELSDLISSQFPLYQDKDDSSPEQFKLKMYSNGQFPLTKRNDFHKDLVLSPVPSLHAFDRVCGATSDDHWLVQDSHSSTSAAEPEPELGNVPNIITHLKSEPLQTLPLDTLSQEDADEEFYIDWNRGKPKMVSRPYDMEQCSIKPGSSQDTQNVPQSLNGTSPPSSSDSIPVNNHVVPDLDGDLRKAVLYTRLEASADTTTQASVMHMPPLTSQQRRKPIITNPSTDGKQVEVYDTYLESSGGTETDVKWTGDEPQCGAGSTATIDDDQLHGRSSRHLGQSQVQFCRERFKRPNDVGESQPKKSNLFEKRIVMSTCPTMHDPEASSHVLRKPTMDTDFYGPSGHVRSDQSMGGVSRYQGSAAWQQGHNRMEEELFCGSDRSGGGGGGYRYRGSAGWQQRQQGQTWGEEEEVEMKTSRWGRYLSKDDGGFRTKSEIQIHETRNIGCFGDPSESRLQINDRGNMSPERNQSDDLPLYQVLDADCTNFFGRVLNHDSKSVTRQSDNSSCDAVKETGGSDTRTTGQLMDEFDDSFEEDCLQEDNAMLSKEDLYKPKYVTQKKHVQHSPHTCSEYIRNTDSSLSPDLFITPKQGTNSVCTKFTSPRFTCGDSVGSSSVLSSRKVGLSKFRNPVMMSFSSSTLKGSQRSLCGELQFPSHSEVEANVTPARQVVIPASFQNLQAYKQVITAALREHLNIMLFELSKIYHSALGRVDITQYSGDGGSSKLPGKSTAISNPPCKCGIPSKLVQVRKEGPNKGRFFYACEAPRNQQCKFFQWMDQTSNTGSKTATAAGVTRASLGSADSIMAYIRGNSVTFYCQCLYLHKHRDSYNKHRKGIPAWVRQRQEESRKKSTYIRLSKKDASSYYAKDDLWVVSQSLMFEPGKTFVARSVYFGPNSSNEVEIDPISGFSPSNWTNNCECHAMLAGNASTELSCLGNLEEHVQLSCLPVLPYILDRVEDNRRHGVAAPSHTRLCTPGNFIMKLAEDYLNQFKLNKDQSEALMRVAAMMNKDGASSEPVLLIHGVFGAGKSFLLSVIIRFLVDVFDKNDSYSPDVPFPWKLLISSTTNVAVDRVLMGLLNLGFEDFIRVGSVKKIAKPVLPYSVHASGSDSQELKDLQEMLRSDIPAGDKQLVRKSIEKHRLGENKKKLGGVRVVGATCAACSFNCLHNMHFPFVVLDECSQMTEPSSLLPIARFSCEKLVLVGDPKQLDPTIQGSEAAHSDGLEQTLFDRLMKLDYCPVLLRTQYRCHPRISGIANTLFYSGQLCDGVTEDSRQPLSPVFPTLSFYNEAGGQEVTDGSGSYYNESEARLVVLLIHALVMEGVEAGSIGVITLYKAQMYKIITSLHTDNPAVNKQLKCVQVSTVDAFQGGEKDVIILSCVRTNNIGFIDSDKRANVALTRARHHLLIVGHQKNLSRNKLWSRVIQICRDYPGGLQMSSTATVELAALVEERQGQALTGSSQEGPGSESTGQGRKKRTSRKRKRCKEEDSPPMSLSGQGTDSSGQSVEILTPQDVPVNDNMAVADVAGSGVGQDILLTEDFVLSECSVNTLSTEYKKNKRPRRSHLLDPEVFLDDKINSSDEDLPSHM